MMVFVFNSEPMLSKFECDFIKKAYPRVEKTVFVQSKSDLKLKPGWEERLRWNKNALRVKANIQNPIIYPTSIIFE